jgi:hypothetical protein
MNDAPSVLAMIGVLMAKARESRPGCELEAFGGPCPLCLRQGEPILDIPSSADEPRSSPERPPGDAEDPPRAA